MRRKFLSVVLCVCMMLTMAPFAFAAGTDTGSNTEEAGTSIPANSSSGAGGGAGSVSTSTTNAITNEADLRTALESANDEDTITISGTISIDAPLVITKTVTLTGGSITASDSFTANSNKLADMSLISLKTAGKVLTLKDITLDAKKKTLVVFSNAGKVVVDGATITGGKTNSSVAGVYMTNASEFEMTSGSIRSNEVGKTDYSKYAADLWVGANAKATLSGGNIDNIFVNANSFSENNPGYFKMQDGHVTNLYAEYYENYGATVIYDGGTLDNLYISTTASNGACENVTPVAGMTYKGGQTDAAALTPVAKVDAKKFTSLADAIATADNKTVILLKDVTEDVVIPSDKTVTLNLNGKKLTNVSSNTITNNGTLTITGTGTVDNVTHQKAALYNKGTATLEGGTFDRTKENGKTKEQSGNNSWYTIKNVGTMTVKDGVTVQTAGNKNSLGKFSSLVSNGYFNNSDFTNNKGIDNPKLTIEGGNFLGGLNTIKNDDRATLTIKNGTFSNYYQAVVQNHNVAEIKGGTFTAASDATSTTFGVDNCGCAEGTDLGTLTISGGTFAGATYAVFDRSTQSPNITISAGNFAATKASIAKSTTSNATISVTGGYFTSDPTAYVASGYAAKSSKKADYAYMVAKKENNEVIVKPTVATPNVTLGSDIDNAKQEAVKASAQSVKVPEIANAAAKNVSISSSQAEQYIKEANLTSSTGQEVILYVQSFLDVTPTAYDENSKTYTLDITPKYQIIASTATTADQIKLDAAPDKNAVVVEQATVLNVTEPTQVSLTLPNSFVTALGENPTIYVKHVKDNGKTYIYTASLNGNTLTFTNPHGFSEFTVTTTAPVATVDGIGYKSLQDAVDAAANRATIVLNSGTSHTLNLNTTKSVTVKNSTGAKTTITFNGTAKEIAIDGEETFTYTRPSSSTPTTYAVNVNAATNGAVAADKKTASKGTTVTVTASPSKGYVVDAVKVVDKDGKDVAVTGKDGKYVFTMPGSAVTVTGTFKAETPAPVALPFTDVKSGNWFYDAVKYAYAQGLMTGTSATTFAPNGTMNRAMIVTVLYRLEKSPAVTGASKFTDVPAGQWYSDAVAWAAANKIVNGYDETAFGPMNAVTREQMAAILFRYEQVKGLENVTLEENLNRFPDQNKISAYAIPALQWAVGQKIINGNADGTLDPTGTATRAQVAQIFTNLLNK